MIDRIEVILGDITKLDVDAIVNAANPSLMGGGGVDGAIHSAAGQELKEECSMLGGCQTGEAKLTKGYRLPARHVIHTVGPVWGGGEFREDDLLRNCYRNSLSVAIQNNIKTIAFPAISTGIYGFPIERAAKIAVDEVNKFLSKNDLIEKVTFVCFSQNDFNIYKNIISEHI